MKNIRLLSILLAVLLMLQCCLIPAYAAEVSDSQPGGETEATEAQPEETVPAVPFGNASVTNGCRTIDGQSPLGGSERMLETAQAAFIYETSTDTLVYAYNPDLRLYPGSLSKILTALIAIEEGDLSDVITVSTREISKLPAGALDVKLKEGEKVTLNDLLHCLILASANDAALVIAEYVAGNEAEFVVKMNERLQKIGCTNTYLTNCHGLDDPQQYTTVRDMAKIVREAVKNETFKELFVVKQYDVPPTNKMEKERELASGNHLVYELVLPQFNDLRVTGGMPSYVSAAAGASIVFTAEDKGMSFIYVIMGSVRTLKENGYTVKYYGNFEESLDLLEYSYSNYKINRLLYNGQSLSQFPVSNGESSVVACSKIALDTVLPVTAKMDNLQPQYTIRNGGLNAPIAKGEQIGSVQLWYNTSCVAETELYAMSPVKAVGNTGVTIYSIASRDDSNLSDVLSFLGILILIVVVPFGIYLAINHFRRSMTRARRRRRRASRRRSR